MKKFIFIFALSIFLGNFIDIFGSNYERFILENGLEVYAIQDELSPISNVFYVNEAGFASQSKENTGFFELYAKVFWKTNPNFQEKSKEILLSDIDNSITNHQSVYNFSVPTEFLENSLELLSFQLKNPSFENEVVKTAFFEMKEKIQNFEKGPEGFINGAIDLQIFPNSPWKQGSAINPPLFKTYNQEKTRSILISIADNYYIPNTSAIIISSCFSPNEILSLVKKYFSDWNKKISQSEEISFLSTRNENEQKKFILLSSDFSKELTQIIVQYIPQNFFENQKNVIAGRLASIILEENDSVLKSNLVKNENLGILAEEYINANFSYFGTDSRIIIQSLLQNSNISPMQQEKIFTDTINSSINFNDFELKNSVRKLSGQTNLAKDSALQFAKSIAYNWAYEKNDFTKATQEIAQTVTTSEMTECFSNKPYVFLLMNPTIYSKWKTENQNSEYSIITEENAYWYKLKKYNANNFQNKQTTEILQNEIIDKQISQRIIEKTKNNSGNFSLTNGIDVNYSLNSENSTASIMLCFEGGENVYSKKYRGMETILLKTLAKLIEIEIDKAYKAGILLDTGNIQASAGINSGNLILSCTTQDFPIMLGCINKGIIFGEITPAMEDELVYMEKSKWRYLNNMLDFQLKTKALTSFYKGSDFEYLFNCTSDILQQITFNEIRAMYTKLINASRISIIVTGNPGFNFENQDKILSLQNSLNNYFGSLKSLPFEKKDLPEPQFSKMTQISRLKRIFTTNIKAEDAGPRPEKLIPTTEFFDPALLILQVPKKTYNEFTNFSLAIRGFEKFLQDEISKNTTKLFSDVEIINFEETDGNIAFQFYDVKNSTELYKYIELKAKEFSKINYLSTNKNEFTFLKNYWITKEIPKTNSSENLAKKIYSSIKINLPAQFYLNQYEKISELTLEEYQNSFSEKIAEYFSNFEPYWIFSADTKR